MMLEIFNFLTLEKKKFLYRNFNCGNFSGSYFFGKLFPFMKRNGYFA